MLRLTRLYLRSYLLRDLLILAAVVAIALLYWMFSYTHGYKWLIAWWIAGCVAYTFVTSFRHAFDSDRCVSPILLPVSEPVKFSFTLIRTLILFPALSFAGIIVPLSIFSHASFHSLITLLTYSRLPLYHLPVVPYFLLWFSSLALLTATFPPRFRPAATLAALVIAYISLSVLDVSGVTSYPFVTINTDIWIKGFEWQSIYSWTGLPVKAQYFISYLWLLMLPAAVVAISYFRFKEINFSRWN